MLYFPRGLAALLLPALGGCVTNADLATATSFDPYVTENGAHAFRFVAPNQIPAYYGGSEGMDLRPFHESLAANEAVKHHYCPGGFDIVSQSENTAGYLTYEGVCR